jgi:hypothetical protein
MARAAKTADQLANSWVSGMQNAGQRYKDGISNVTESPMAKAAQPDAMNRYLSGVQNSVSSGKRAAALQSADFNQWKQNALNVGAGRLGTGAQKAKSRFQNQMNKWAPVYQQASQAAQAIPHDGSMGSALARVQASMQVMMSAAGKS